MKINIASFLYIGETADKGRGVFTSRDIPPMKTIETSSVLVMDAAARKLLDQTLLHDYIFEWSTDDCCVAWGYISLYNHSHSANCEYFMDYEQKLITIQSIRAIKSGEELTINYTGAWNDTKPVWFPVK